MPLGNVTLKREGDRDVTLNFGVNAMCRLEGIDGRHHQEVLREMQSGQPRMTTIRSLVQAALVDPEGVSPEEAGHIIEDIGGPSVIVMAFAASLEQLEAIGAQIEAGARADGEMPPAAPAQSTRSRRKKDA
jgi:hypothetical protein